jgi:hypothetical protein
MIDIPFTIQYIVYTYMYLAPVFENENKGKLLIENESRGVQRLYTYR